MVIFIISFIGFYGEVLLATFLLTDTSQYTYAVGLSLFATSEYTAKWGLDHRCSGCRCDADRAPLPRAPTSDSRGPHRRSRRGNTSPAAGRRAINSCGLRPLLLVLVGPYTTARLADGGWHEPPWAPLGRSRGLRGSTISGLDPRLLTLLPTSAFRLPSHILDISVVLFNTLQRS